MATNLDFSQEFEESFPSHYWEQFDVFSIPKSHLNLIVDQKISPENVADIQDAISNWKKDAANGSPEAQFYLGKCYEEGISVLQSFKEAIKGVKPASLLVTGKKGAKRQSEARVKAGVNAEVRLAIQQFGSELPDCKSRLISALAHAQGILRVDWVIY